MKFYIIPTTDGYIDEIDASNATDAMIDFATHMDLDMNAYFRAVTEEEYERIKDERMIENDHQMKIEFFMDELDSSFDMEDEEMAAGVAERAYEIYCEGKGCTEYEALEQAYDEWEAER